MELVEPIKLTEDMVGDMFETREGKVITLQEYELGLTYGALCSDGSRTYNGRFIHGRITDPKDIVKHLPKSQYPEYYL